MPAFGEGLRSESPPPWADSARLNFVWVKYYEKAVVLAPRDDMRLAGMGARS